MWKFLGKDKDLGQYVDMLNTGRGPGLVRKEKDQTEILEAVDWDKQARFGIGARKKGLWIKETFRLPSKNFIKPTSSEEALLRQRRPGARFSQATIKDGSIFSTSSDITGAIPVYDLDRKIRDPLYFIPTYIGAPPNLRALKAKKLRPVYVILKKGDLPSYVFWEPAYALTQDTSTRNLRSAAPSPDAPNLPRSRTIFPAPVTTNTVPRSRASRPAPSTPNAKQQLKLPIETALEVFDPREEEQDNTEFLDCYNVKTNGYHAIRISTMLREEDINRVNYKSACLHHHSGGSQDREMVDAGPFVEPPPPEPIPDDDPSLVAFRKKLQRREEIRQNRQQPELVFTREYCNEPGAEKDPEKATLTRSMYMQYLQRAKIAEFELERRSKCCRACGLDWSKTKATRIDHYNKHRHEYTLWLEKEDPQEPAPQPLVKTSSLTPQGEGVPELGWFTMLERLIYFYENEILERGQVCVVCDDILDYAHVDPADHYTVHAGQRDGLRALNRAARAADPSTPTTAKIVDANGKVIVEEPLRSGQTESTVLSSPEARQFTRMGPKHPLAQRDAENKKRMYVNSPLPWDRIPPSPGIKKIAGTRASPSSLFNSFQSAGRSSGPKWEAEVVSTPREPGFMSEIQGLGTSGSVGGSELDTQNLGIPAAGTDERLAIDISSDDSSSEYVSSDGDGGDDNGDDDNGDDDNVNVVIETPKTPIPKQKPFGTRLPPTPATTPALRKRKQSDATYILTNEPADFDELYDVSPQPSPVLKKRKKNDPTFRPNKSEDSLNSPPQTPASLITRRGRITPKTKSTSPKKVDFSFVRQEPEPSSIKRGKVSKIKAGKSALKSDKGKAGSKKVVADETEVELAPRRSSRLAKEGRKDYKSFK